MWFTILFLSILCALVSALCSIVLNFELLDHNCSIVYVVKYIVDYVIVVYFIFEKKVVVANAGDAKAVLARSTSADGEGAVDDAKSQLKAIVLTREHKAIFPQERARIQKVTCCFTFNIYFSFPAKFHLSFVLKV